MSKGPFTWTEDDPPSAVCFQLSFQFSAFIRVKGCIWPQCWDHPTARIILSERKDGPGARMILPSCKRPQKAQFAHPPS